jgi:GT2 family glycosyltransferase
MQPIPGFAKANNQGMAIAKGEVLLWLLNSDTEINHNAPEKLVAFS